MNFVVWTVVGGLLGSVASMMMGTDRSQGILNVVVGIVGALIAGFMVAPMFGTGTITSNDNISIPGLLVSLPGALILLAIVNLFRRGTVEGG